MRNVGQKTAQLWEKYIKIGGNSPKILPENLVYVGVRDTEEAEERIIEKHRIKRYSIEEVRRNIEAKAKQILNDLSNCDHIYVSFDVDSMDEQVSKGTGTSVKGGFWSNEAEELLDCLLRHPKICCFEMTEINPDLDKLDTHMPMAAVAFPILQKATETLEI